MNNKYPTTKPSLNLDFANAKSLDPRITFRRGTPGTYYDGVTHVKAEENLIDYSEDFSQWGNQREELTAGQSAPDGSSGAYKVAQASGQVYPLTISRVVNMNKGENYTYSIYAKAGTNRDYLNVRIYDYSISDYYQFFLFDLGNGQTLDNAGKNIDYYGGTHEIQDVGNDWYRCIVNFPVVNDSSDGFMITNYVTDDPLYLAGGLKQVADDGGFIYLWGAQLEQRDGVTAYTKTEGTPVTKYQPKLMTASPDDARFDHDPITGESKGLLIEEQRTNLIDYSEDFSSGGWNKVRLERVETDTIISPDGKLSGEKYIQEDGNLEGGNLHKIITLTSGITYTSSVYAKKGQFNQIRLFENNVNDSVETTIFSLDDGTLVSQSTYHDSYSITDIGNGWYRFSITFTASSTATTLVGFYLHDSSSVTGNGYKGTYIWGAQLETGSFPTSYIKTAGASATRSDDNASIVGENFSSWYRQDEGSILFDLKLNEGSEWKYIFGITNDGNWEQGLISARHIGSNVQSNLGSIDNNSSQIGFVQDGNFFNLGFAYKDDSAFINTNIASDEYAPKIASGLNRIDFFSVNGSDYKSCGHIKKLAYYPQRLTNEQLQNLTK